MADKNSLIKFVVQKIGPEKLKEMVDQVEQELSQDPDVTQEALDELVKQLNYVVENPEAYKEVVASAAQAGMIDPNDVPPEFDPVFIAVLLIAVTELSHRVSKQGSQMFAKGGLAKAAKQIAAQGRGGDTMLAHINPREAEVLRRMGGAGTINPNTGLHEFKGGILGSIGKIVKSVAKAVVPIVATAAFGPAGGALAGAAMGAIGGGGLKGALLGGITGSLVPGGYLGGVANTVGKTVLDTGIGSMLSGVIGPQTLGAGLLGGAASALAGKGFVQGALSAGGMAAASPTVNSLYGKVTGPGGLFSSQAGGTGVNLGSSGGLNQVGGNLLATSGGPSVAVPAATTDIAASGLPSFDLAPATVAEPGIALPKFDMGAAVKDAAGNFNPSLTDVAAANAGKIAAPAASTGILGTGLTAGNVLTGITALNALGGLTPQQAQLQIANSSLTEQQKADMARNLTNYTASWNQTTLPKQGTPEYEDMMSKISQGIGINFMNPTTAVTPSQTAMKRGGKTKAPAGALSQVAMLANGTGSGRDDTINAKLSDGEYVIDAETVALLGNGSTKAGAAALDQMREQIRQQKGKALAKGKFSPNAKSPLAYMKGGLK